MAIVSQTWTRYVLENNPLGFAVNYTATTMIAHITSWFTANTAQWTVSDSGTNYVELKPPAGTSINPDDRVLFWGGVSPNAAAVVSGISSSAGFVYVCYAPNAGTTGPDVLPSTGNPYTGVTSSLLLVCASNPATFEALQVFQSNDCLALWCGSSMDSATPAGSSLAFVGRAYNPIGTTNQFTIVVGQGGSTGVTWCTLLEADSNMWTADPSQTSNNHGMWVQESAGDVAWVQCRRVNSWPIDQFQTQSTEQDYYFNIQLGSNVSAGNVFLGEVLFVKAGPPANHGIEIADSTSTLGYAQSNTMQSTTSGTWYTWNE